MELHKWLLQFVRDLSCLWGGQGCCAESYEERKSTSSETFKSPVSEHVAATNHVIGWEEAKVID